MDEDKKEKFTLHALLLWTMNDFPAYAILSGWSTKGKFACPYCHKDAEYLWLKFGSKHCYMRKCKSSFNNMTEMRKALVALTGPPVLQQHSSFEQPKFGTTSKKRKQREEDIRSHNWRKKIIFFRLLYLEKNLIRHNCESIIGTLLNIDGKCKDSEKARLEMQNLRIWQDQQLVVENG
jgi:hypothetical protein